MASGTESSDEENAELKDTEEKIDKLSSAITELCEKVRPFNDELTRLRQRKRECVDKLHHLTAEKHERMKDRQRLIELESELKHVKFENSRLLVKNTKLKQSLDQGTRNSRIQKQRIAELETQAQSETVDSSTVSELKEQLSQKTKLLEKTKEELYEMRQHLSGVQERLTVSEQVTAATQKRLCHESVNTEELQLELTPQPQPTTDAGSASVSQSLTNILTAFRY